MNYSAGNGTASSASDYVAKARTLTFAAGQTTKAVTVTVKGDAAKEATETFFVNLLSPTNAAFGVSKATGTIRNDD